MYLYRLKNLKREMSRSNQLLAGMNFKYGSITLEVIFFNLEDKLLLFKKTNSKQSFLIKVEKDFSIDTKLDKESYKKLAKMFPKNGNASFNPYDFFLSFSKSVPNYEYVYHVDINENINYISEYIDDIKDSKFIGYYNHKNDGKRVTAKNLNKTALYLGKEEADRCKRENISTIWKSLT